VAKQFFNIGRIHMIASTQVSDSVPEAMGGQLRVEALQPEID